MFLLFALIDMILMFCLISNQKKRKAPSVIEISSDSSDVYVFLILMISYVLKFCSSETVKAPVTPSKKRSRPSPGTPEFDLLPAVSLTYAFIILVPYLVLILLSLKGANWKR